MALLHTIANAVPEFQLNQVTKLKTAASGVGYSKAVPKLTPLAK